jgi:hypothetical protein
MLSRERRAFTLLEVLMAFGAGSLLIGVIYFFHFGMLHTNRETVDIIYLNERSELARNQIANDLRMTYYLTELKPDRIVLHRLPAVPIGSDERFALDRLRLITVEYSLARKDRENKTSLLRREGIASDARSLFDVDWAAPDVFSGFVYILPREKGDPVPRFRVFDPVQQSSTDLRRITMVRTSLNLKLGKRSIHLVGKTFVPLAFTNTLQAHWNIE